ncbi:hypothetical protein PEDI_40760 [Persicobacter diffluens]|uniref:Uncharacterized protein n=1 Tax=Persicobacter diffluens TaxID=981 RepID=A0AAN4W0N5_9BACT|nr:hypothetical protein PEDI_40760 [Persicobacter diffluens]
MLITNFSKVSLIFSQHCFAYLKKYFLLNTGS